MNAGIVPKRLVDDVSDDDDGDDEQLDWENIDEDMARYSEESLLSEFLELGAGTDGSMRQKIRKAEQDLRRLEKETFNSYVAERSNNKELLEHVASCDGVLKTYEDVLVSFERDLTKLSDEITGLQEVASNLHVLQENRKEAETELATFIQMGSIPEDLITAIMAGEVDEGYAEHLKALEQRCEVVSSRGVVASSSAEGGFGKVKVALDRLTQIAVDRVVKTLVSKTTSLSNERVLVKVLTLGQRGGGKVLQSEQQTSLLAYKGLCHYLKDNGPLLWTAYRSKYSELMSSIYLSHLRSEVAAANRGVLLLEPGAVFLGGGGGGGIMGMIGLRLGGGGGAKHQQQQHHHHQQQHQARKKGGGVYNVLDPRRVELLRTDWPDGTETSAAGTGGDTLPEVAFRRIISAVLRCCISEFNFVTEFFGRDAFVHSILSEPLSAVEVSQEALVKQCSDPVALLLMLSTIQDAQSELHPRLSRELGPFFDRMRVAIWPLFKASVDSAAGSIHAAHHHAPANGRMAPPLVQKFASLACILYRIAADLDPQSHNSVDRSIQFLRLELEKVVNKGAGAGGGGAVQAIVLLWQQVCALRVGGLAGGDLEDWEARLETCLNEWAGIEAGQGCFGAMSQLVKSIEAQELAAVEALTEAEVRSEAASARVGFEAGWKAAFQRVASTVLGRFPSHADDVTVLGKFFTEVLTVFDVFCDIEERYECVGAGQGLQMSNLIDEIRAYSLPKP